jgi:transcriptional regulator
MAAVRDGAGDAESMFSAIPVVDIIVDKVEGRSKMNQHKVHEDLIAVTDELASSENFTSLELAAKMRKLRPHLTYGSPE